MGSLAAEEESLNSSGCQSTTLEIHSCWQQKRNGSWNKRTSFSAPRPPAGVHRLNLTLDLQCFQTMGLLSNTFNLGQFTYGVLAFLCSTKQCTSHRSVVPPRCPTSSPLPTSRGVAVPWALEGRGEAGGCPVEAPSGGRTSRAKAPRHCGDWGLFMCNP